MPERPPKFQHSTATPASAEGDVPKRFGSLIPGKDTRDNAQIGNLRFLERALHEQWNLGKNIILCWTPTATSVDILVVPHYFLGNFSASLNDEDFEGSFTEANGRFIRELISNSRQMSEREFAKAETQLRVPRRSIKLPIPLSDDPLVLNKVDEIVIRHSISFVAQRAVLLFDIAGFSLFSPFEQTSQLTSLSYSLNSAHNKMLKKNIDINFSRTSTGDGFYIWNRDRGPLSTVNMYQFMLLAIADNALAKRKARGNTVPVIRAGFHVGSHYEFYHAEGLNPTMSSYIVGDVTIELARMLDLAEDGQIFMGDFSAKLPTSDREGAYMIEVDSKKFVERATRHLSKLKGIELAGEEIISIHSYLTGETGVSAGQTLRRFKITDKHGRSRFAFNLRSNIHVKNGKPIILGLQDYYLPRSSRSQRRTLEAETTTTTLYKSRRYSPDITEER